ncbi:MAG: hypothetical protein AAF658_07345 [Myxococcota bacterium]
MRITLGTVAADVPDDWSDASVLKFVADSSSSEPPPSIVITRTDYDGMDLTFALAEHSSGLSDTVIEYEELGQSRHDDTHVLEHAFGDSPRLGQLVALRVLDDVLFIVTGTCLVSELESHRDRFLAVAQSLTPT